jgi:hypothetical protein
MSSSNNSANFHTRLHIHCSSAAHTLQLNIIRFGAFGDKMCLQAQILLLYFKNWVQTHILHLTNSTAFPLKLTILPSAHYKNPNKTSHFIYIINMLKWRAHILHSTQTLNTLNYCLHIEFSEFSLLTIILNKELKIRIYNFSFPLIFSRTLLFVRLLLSVMNQACCHFRLHLL